MKLNIAAVFEAANDMGIYYNDSADASGRLLRTRHCGSGSLVYALLRLTAERLKSEGIECCMLDMLFFRGEVKRIADRDTGEALCDRFHRFMIADFAKGDTQVVAATVPRLGTGTAVREALETIAKTGEKTGRARIRREKTVLVFTASSKDVFEHPEETAGAVTGSVLPDASVFILNNETLNEGNSAAKVLPCFNYASHPAYIFGGSSMAENIGSFYSAPDGIASPEAAIERSLQDHRGTAFAFYSILRQLASADDPYGV